MITRPSRREVGHWEGGQTEQHTLGEGGKVSVSKGGTSAGGAAQGQEQSHGEASSEQKAVRSETDLTVSALCLILVILETANP